MDSGLDAVRLGQPTGTPPMSMLYLLSLVGVSIAVVLCLAEAVLAVSQRPPWEHARRSMMPSPVPALGEQQADSQAPNPHRASAASGAGSECGRSLVPEHRQAVVVARRGVRRCAPSPAEAHGPG